MNSIICEAISGLNLLEFDYEGESRTVEPHCYGVTSANNPGLRAFQVGGFSSSGKMGWKLYDLSKASNIKKLDDNFSGARPGYKRGDKGMASIYCEL